ncbi:MAG TPA: 2-hydroxy-3-oxopropionate reductase [Thermomicrobiales bacterium]|nr:2-hydroxy-3-oxopropionate reductase [Thermomicrobiales bacterium]
MAESTARPTIGLIGLGIMGRPMAHNLLKAGYRLVVHNRSRGPVDELAAAGATPAGSSREVAAQADVIITMLPDSPDVEAVMRGPDGVFAGARPGTIIIDMSTISPVVTQALAEEARAAGLRILDAPVSGGDKGAIAGTLSIMVGGDAALFDECQPIFAALGKTIVHVGPNGAGQTVKACNQVVVAIAYEAISEALVLGARAGVAPEKIIEVLNGGLAATRVMELRGPTMIKHDFTPGFRVRLHQKDLAIALATGKAFGVPLPVTALVDQMLAALRAAGRADLDHSALLSHIEDLAHWQIGSDTPAN